MSDEEVVREKYPDAYINEDYSGSPSADVAVFRKATKEDWPKNREIPISAFKPTNAEAWADAAGKILQSAPREDKWVDVRQFTERGFQDFCSFRDRYGSLISVRQSSLATEDCVWVFATDNPQIKEPSPHLTVDQAKRVSKALLAFVERFEPAAPPVPKEPVGEEGLTQELFDALTMLYEKYENGTTCFESCDGVIDEDSSSIGNAVKLSGEEEDAVLNAIKRFELKSKQEDGGRS